MFMNIVSMENTEFPHHDLAAAFRTLVHWYTGTLVHWYTGTLVHWYLKFRRCDKTFEVDD